MASPSSRWRWAMESRMSLVVGGGVSQIASNVEDRRLGRQWEDRRVRVVVFYVWDASAAAQYGGRLVTNDGVVAYYGWCDAGTAKQE
ncbi:iron ABC transporter ATP-binding protein [Sesbania bispinosa]|nr:iron ABC transporter ATP-binding protein [Sesbania bispinosa]